MPIMSSMGALTYGRRASTEWYIGRFVEGGYYIGDFLGYRIILSPETSQSNTSLRLQTSLSPTGINNVNDGLANTNAWVALNPTNTPAAKYCYDLTTNGYTDWFLPAKNQLNLIYTALPVLINIGEEPYASPTTGRYLWSSSESTTDPTFAAWIQFFRGPPFSSPNGQQSETRKDTAVGVQPYVRAIRQVLI